MGLPHVIYAAGGSGGCGGRNSIWAYTIAGGAWTKISDLPFEHGCDGACTVSGDGWLYVTNGDSQNLARLQLK